MFSSNGELVMIILNPDKCKTVTFSRSRVTLFNVYINNDVDLEHIDLLKNISIIFDSKMPFNEHVHRIVAVQIHGLIKRTYKEIQTHRTHLSLVKSNLM